MNQPKRKREWKLVLILFIIALLIKLISLDSDIVEQYYSTGLYVFISRTLRFLLGWLPFSIGDVFYAAVILWLLVTLIRLVRSLFKKQFTKQKFITGIRHFIQLVLIVYILFNTLWGLNYNRKGIAYQLQLHPQQETKDDLDSVTLLLLQKVNTARRNLPTQVQYLSYQQSFSMAVEAYQNAEEKYPFLQYRFRSIKPSLYSLAGNYLGYSGYYNPFSAEAQVNVKMLPFTTPYVTCHEMAHQLGYATEDEANFVGYLAAKSSPDPQFQYSVYYDLFSYANSELFLFDSVAARENYKQLDTLVKRDIKTERLFWQHYENAIEPIITLLYGNYLKANNQPEGMKAYSHVTAWLIEYKRKYGDL